MPTGNAGDDEMKTTIELAREAGFETMLRKEKILGFDRDGDYTEELKAFEALVRADEREIDAKVCEEVERKSTKQPPMVGLGCQACAAAIRARGN
jgi:nicotinamidase-related amidase